MYLNEKLIVARERVNGSYSTAAYVLGHFLVELVYLLYMTVCIIAVMYYLAGLNPRFTRFLFFGLIMYCSLVVAESIMFLIAAIVPILLVGIAMGAFLFGAFMVVQGYFTSLKHIPWVLRWMTYISLHAYSFAAMVINEFSGRVYAASPDSFPAFPEAVPGEDVIDSLTFVTDNRWANIGAMVAMIVVYRVIAYAWIAKFHTGKR